MTGTGENLVTENAPRPNFDGADSYTKVPWLMIYTWGEESEEVAKRLAAQCRERRVDWVEIRAVDELVAPEDTDLYPVIVFIVSADTNTKQDIKSKRLAKDVIKRYRQRRKDGLDAVFAGRRAYGLAGVVQLVVLAGARPDQPGPALAALLHEACRDYRVEVGVGELPDLLVVFDGPPGMMSERSAPRPREVDHVEVLWEDARQWGVTTPEEVHGIVEIIDSRRSHYRNIAKPAPGVIHPDHPNSGALDLALDYVDVWAERPEGLSEAEYQLRKKNFTQTAQRAVRETTELVQLQFPAFRRPDGKQGTKNQRPAFRRIFNTLRALQRLLDAEAIEADLSTE